MKTDKQNFNTEAEEVGTDESGQELETLPKSKLGKLEGQAVCEGKRMCEGGAELSPFEAETGTFWRGGWCLVMGGGGVRIVVLSVVLSRGGDQLFFQAEDGIRDVAVTGVQTCALPI